MEPDGGSPSGKPQPPAKVPLLPPPQASSSRVNSSPTVNQAEEEARMHLASVACDLSMNPLSFCEENGPFRRYINTLNPNCSFSFDFESLQRSCFKIYVNQRKTVKETFAKFGCRISLSLDLLKYERSSLIEDCVCITAHFIDDDWKLRRWVIKYCCLNNKTPMEIAFKTLKGWDIERKILALTLGGATDIVGIIKEDIQEVWNVPVNGQIFHMLNSSSDIIAKMVQEGFKEIEDVINKVELLAWSQSLPLWYLTSSKLQEALELEALGEFSSESVRRDYNVPTEEEWAEVRSICGVVEKIYEIVKGLFEAKRPTANMFLPHVQEIQAYLIQESANADDFVKAVAQKMLKTFNEYWEDVHLLLAIAAFCIPNTR